MSYHGDIALAGTIDLLFSTVNEYGVPTTLGGSPVVSAYVGNGTTELTAGITLDVNFDGRTGLHHVRVVASGANGYAANTDVTLVITTGTVNGISVVGMTVGSFSIQNRVVKTVIDGVSVGVGGILANSFAASAIDAAAIANGAIDAATFAAGAIDAAAIANGAIDAATFAANAIDASALAQDAAQEIADEVLNRNIAGGGSGNTRNVRNALRSLRNRVQAAAGTATIYQEDDATPAWTATVTTTPGSPISEIDPT